MTDNELRKNTIESCSLSCGVDSPFLLSPWIHAKHRLRKH